MAYYKRTGTGKGVSIIMKEKATVHFTKRAKKYNRSSAWVHDDKLIEKMFTLSEADKTSSVLDIAIGTGKISAAFHKRVKYNVGIDICTDMTKQSIKHTDNIVLSKGELLPFKEHSFDCCVCRQGMQFMKLDSVLSEVYKVLKPNGTVVFYHLTAYNEKDRETAFRVQELRNPARTNFFVGNDFADALKRNKYSNIESIEYISRESVNVWIDNGAISDDQMEMIRETYRNASDEFKQIHDIEFTDDDIFDSMRMLIVKAKKIS